MATILKDKVDEAQKAYNGIINLFHNNPELKTISFNYYTEVDDNEALFWLEDISINDGDIYESIWDIGEGKTILSEKELDELHTNLVVLLNDYSYTDSEKLVIEREELLNP